MRYQQLPCLDIVLRYGQRMNDHILPVQSEWWKRRNQGIVIVVIVVVVAVVVERGPIQNRIGVADAFSEPSRRCDKERTNIRRPDGWVHLCV